MALPQENKEMRAVWGWDRGGERQMQFIVIYGVRFIYGGQYRLSGDWERMRLEVKPLTTKESPRNRGTALSWALFHARERGFFGTWLLP